MEVVMNVDYYDEVIATEKLYDETLIEQLMINCKQHGVDIVNWRLSICGKRAYWSKSRPEDIFREGPSNAAGHKMKEILEKFDPLEVALQLARKHGLKLYAWIDLNDEYYMRAGDTVGLESDFFTKNPQYTWVSRDGQEHVPGIICYEYPEVVAFRLKEIEEVIEYGVDGLYLCTRTHARHNVPRKDEDYYGFNEPWVNKYKERYGVDPRTSDFDSERFSAIRGESITEFLRLVKQRTEEKGIPVSVGINKDLESPMATYPYAKLDMDWKTWVEENIIDELSMCAGEDLYDQSKEWIEEVALDMAEVCESNDVKLGIWLLLWDWSKKFTPPETEATKANPQKTSGTKPPEAFKAMMQQLATYPKLNSVYIHEVLNVELRDMWDVIEGFRS